MGWEVPYTVEFGLFLKESVPVKTSRIAGSLRGFISPVTEIKLYRT
jgi:hypothetical protein